MANEKTGVTGILIGAFLMVIIGVSLIGVIADQANSAVDLTRVPAEAVAITHNATAQNDVDETVVTTLANPPTGWKKADCLLTGVVVTNSTGVAMTVDTDYLVDLTAGTISFLNTSETYYTYDNTTNVKYDYCSDDYLNSSWGRTVLPLVAGFFALAILGVGIALFFKAGKATGII